MIDGKRLLLAASLLSGAAGLMAGGVVTAQPVVQPLPRVSASQALNAALARLGRDPKDLDALIDAGKAALGMGDIDAAIGFFARADQLSPNNMRVKAGLAGAMVRSENPYDAIPLFAEADKDGQLDPMLQADRGLAYDLVGDNATAQRHYREALAAQPNDETLRRLALSQAIAGDRASMELTLSPLLQKQDKAAWRTRAFALAILQKPEEAIAIADQTMPDDMAQSIAPYLRYMPRLTAAQQAAAANFGRFPRAAEIGRDDPRVALYAPPKRVAVAETLVPAGKPLGRTRSSPGSREDRRSRTETAAAAAPVASPAAPRSAPPDPMPTRQVTSPPTLAVSTVAPSPGPGPAPRIVRTAPQAPAPAPAVVPAPAPPPTSVVVVPPASQVTVTMRPASPTPQPSTLPAPRASTVQPSPAGALPAVAPASGSARAQAPLVPGGGFDLARLDPGRTAAPAVVPPAASTAVPAAATAPGSVVTGLAAASATLATSSAAPAAPVPATLGEGPRVAAVAPPVQAVPEQAPAPQQPTAPKLQPAKRALADAFADLTLPKGPAAPAPGAVDVRKLAAAKPKPVEPPKPVHPSRIWVQVGTGRNPSALSFTWKGLVRDNPELFRGKAGLTSDWGRTNRLLTGPFASEAQAQAFLTKAKKSGLDAFLWTSPAGQVVDDL